MQTETRYTWLQTLFCLTPSLSHTQGTEQNLDFPPRSTCLSSLEPECSEQPDTNNGPLCSRQL